MRDLRAGDQAGKSRRVERSTVSESEGRPRSQTRHDRDVHTRVVRDLYEVARLDADLVFNTSDRGVLQHGGMVERHALRPPSRP